MNKVLFTGNFNARSPVWGDELENERDSQLLDFCATDDLMVVNDSRSEPTFSGGMGQSWVDLIMVRFAYSNSKIMNWEVGENEMLSDHMEIRFTYITDHVTPTIEERFDIG